MVPQGVLQDKLSAAFPGSKVKVMDLTGTQDHFLVRIIWDGFAGKSSIARHRLVYRELAEEMQGPIHALTLETRTQDEEDHRNQAVLVSKP